MSQALGRLTRRSAGTPPGPGLLAACLFGGSAGWALTATGAAARTLEAAYGKDLLWVGLLSAALAAPYAALQFPAGVLVDRLGVRVSTVSGLGLALVAHLLALLGPVPALAVGARFASGVGFAVCFVSGAELARASGRGARGMGVFGGVALAASGASVLGVALTEPLLGWRAAWATSAAVCAVALVFALRLPRAGHARRTAPVRTSGATSSLLRDGQLFRLAGLHTMTLGLGLVLSTWATTLLVDIWSFRSAAAAVVGALVLGLSVVSRPLGGHLAAVAPTRNRALWAAVLVACAAATGVLAVPGPGAVAVVAVVVLGISSGLPFAAVVQAAHALQPERPAAAVGLMNTMAFGLVTAGTPAVGWAVDHGWARGAVVVIALLWLLPLASLPRRASADVRLAAERVGDVVGAQGHLELGEEPDLGGGRAEQLLGLADP